MSQQACDEYMQRFPTGKQAKNDERIKFMLSTSAVSDKLEEWINLDRMPAEEGSEEVNPSKNVERSKEKREEGNEFFKRREFGKSILNYNEALKLSPLTLDHPEQNENIALCFGNRSAAYYELGTSSDLQNSLSDTNLALKYGYPDGLKIKLLLRQVNIYLKLGNSKMAHETLRQASMCQGISETMQKKINHLKSEVDQSGIDSTAEKGANESSSSSSTTITPANTDATTTFPTFQENPHFVNASKDLELHFSEEHTRYVKCTKQLNVGDIVFVEEPFASILIPEFYDSYCYHCHSYLQNEYFFPCRSCSQVKFCTEECSIAAWEQYHEFECGHLDLLQSVGIAHLAFKVLLSAGKEQVLEAQSTSNQVTVRDKSVFHKGQRPYHRVYSLLDHIDVMPAEDVFQYSLTASLLINYLWKRTNYFNDDPLEQLYIIGGVLLKHICQLICNAHAITYIASDYNLPRTSVTTAQESQIRIASAIYPSASMMNHSCEPNIASSFIHGRRLVVKVTCDLGEGSQIFNCYGPHMRRMRRESRQEHLLQQYFFNCDCSVCAKEAVDEFSFVDTFQALKCSTCSGPIVPDVSKQVFLVRCQDCGKIEDIELKMRASLQADQIINAASDLLEQGQTEDAHEILVQGLELAQRHLHKYNSDYGQMCDMLGRCFAMRGKFNKAVPYIKQSLNYVRQRFGETSIEYARELKKLCDVQKLCVESSLYEREITVGMEKANQVLSLYEASL